MEITVEIKSVYGTDKVYPVCKNAYRFACIAGTTTLTDYTISVIKRVGYRVKVASGPREL